jgi:hypothetical protein
MIESGIKHHNPNLWYVRSRVFHMYNISLIKKNAECLDYNKTSVTTKKGY